jgi:hypothetical protein
MTTAAMAVMAMRLTAVMAVVPPMILGPMAMTPITALLLISVPTMAMIILLQAPHPLACAMRTPFKSLSSQMFFHSPIMMTLRILRLTIWSRNWRNVKRRARFLLTLCLTYLMLFLPCLLRGLTLTRSSLSSQH